MRYAIDSASRFRPVLVLLGSALLTSAGAAEFQFKVHEIARPGGDRYGQTSLVDVDQDGDLDFISGERSGTLYWFEFKGPDQWIQHEIGGPAPTDVGGTAFDIDGDGWIDQASGSAWFRNPQDPRAKPFERHVNDAISTHDNLYSDIDGDGRLDLVGLRDQSGLFWYKIPEDPTGPWMEHKVIGKTEPQCHGGVAAGDLDGDGDIDLSRVDRWFENLDSRGNEWKEHRVFDFGMEGPWGIQTRAEMVDLDGDDDLDLVQAEGDVLNGRVAWFENRDGKARDWIRHFIKNDQHQQDFHSLCVADFDNDGDPDLFSGGGPLTQGEKKWFIWENRNRAQDWKEHVIQTGYSTHESVCGDIDGDGDVDIATKPWDGDLHLFVENLR